MYVSCPVEGAISFPSDKVFSKILKFEKCFILEIHNFVESPLSTICFLGFLRVTEPNAPADQPPPVDFYW